MRDVSSTEVVLGHGGRLSASSSTLLVGQRLGERVTSLGLALSLARTTWRRERERSREWEGARNSLLVSATQLTEKKRGLVLCPLIQGAYKTGCVDQLVGGGP